MHCQFWCARIVDCVDAAKRVWHNADNKGIRKGRETMARKPGWITQAEVGRRVREARLRRRWSQMRLAMEATRVLWEVHPQAEVVSIHWISRLEKAQTDVVDLEKLSAVAAALNMPLSAFVLPTESAEAPGGPPETQLAAALRAAGLAPAEARRRARTLLEEIRRQGDQPGEAARQDVNADGDSQPPSARR